MKYTSYSYPSGRAEVAAFVVTGGVTEYHVMIHATDPKQTYREQMNVVLDAYAALLKKELSGAVAVFKRYFLSDAANQAELLLAATAESSDCALSVVDTVLTASSGWEAASIVPPIRNTRCVFCSTTMPCN